MIVNSWNRVSSTNTGMSGTAFISLYEHLEVSFPVFQFK